MAATHLHIQSSILCRVLQMVPRSPPPLTLVQRSLLGWIRGEEVSVVPQIAAPGPRGSRGSVGLKMVVALRGMEPAAGRYAEIAASRGMKTGRNRLGWIRGEELTQVLQVAVIEAEDSAAVYTPKWRRKSHGLSGPWTGSYSQ